MKVGEIRELEDRSQLATYKKMDIAVERGRGAWIWTSEGDRYLDLYGGHAVCATGHSHPHVVAALCAQAERLIFYSNLVYSELRARAAEKLVSIAPPALGRAFFCNSGTEANENAMRMARLATGREEVISFSGSFHGRTADAISSSFLGRYRELGKPNVPGHQMAEFGDIGSVRALASERTAAVIVEPIQSMAGVREASPEFFTALRELCGRLGIILIFDEIQTGVGRTGGWFFAGSGPAGGSVPDVVTLAKSLGSGIPVGACLVSEKVAGCVRENELGTTFGGGMMAMAAMLATLEAIEMDAMIENASVVEQHVRKRMANVRGVLAVRGKGCLLGIELSDNAAEVHSRLLDRKNITGTSSDPRVLRLLPPLCVSTSEIDIFVDALAECTERADSEAV